jgi:Domain of unknown function (DUF3854)
MSNSLFTTNDLKSSGIPAWYAQIAVRDISAGAAIEALCEEGYSARNGSAQKNDFTSAADARLRKRYDAALAADGGWIALPSQLEGAESLNPYIKFETPRRDDAKSLEKGRDVWIKYESGIRQEGTPLLPPVTWKMGKAISARGTKAARTAYAKRLREWKKSGAKEALDVDFWNFVRDHLDIPIGITEGWKKALLMTLRGIPTIALRGKDMFFRSLQWEGEKGIPHEVCRILGWNRTVYVALDSEATDRKREGVAQSISRILEGLKKLKADARVVEWDSEKGKGIDDLLAPIQERMGSDEAQAVFEGLLGSAIPSKTWLKGRRTADTLKKLAKAEALTFPAERETEGGYMPELPVLEAGAIHVVSASMGSGKTYRIGKDWIEFAKAEGWFSLVLSPLNSLGQQTAEDWELPHIHDYSSQQQDILWSEANSRGGVVMCFDSLHRLPNFVRDRKLLLILDEAAQGLAHTLEGQTLKGERWGIVVGELNRVILQAATSGAIVLSEDGLPDRAPDYVREVVSTESCAARVRVFSHRRNVSPWQATVFTGHHGAPRFELLKSMSEGKKILYVTTSRSEGQILHRAAEARFPEAVIDRIDSDTNEGGAYRKFFSNPDQWLQEVRPQLLILSPSAKTGVSIEGDKSVADAWFDEVFGYFPGLDCASHWQMLGRYRPAVPRKIFVPPFVNGTAAEKAGQQGGAWFLAERIRKFAVISARKMGAQVAELAESEKAILNFISQGRAAAGLGKSVARAALVERLEKAGHLVALEKGEYSQELCQEWKEIKQAIWLEEAEEIAAVRPSPTQDLEWAIASQSKEISRAERLVARKVLWRSEFPGVDFDEVTDCYEGMLRDHGRISRGVKLQARAENPSLAFDAEKVAIRSVLGGDLRALHRLPSEWAKAHILDRVGVLALLDGTPYSNADPRLKIVKERAATFKKEIGYWLGLYPSPDHSAVDIAHRLLSRLGLEMGDGIDCVGRPGKRGEKRDRFYQVNLSANPVRQKLLEAYRCKLSEAVSINSNNIDSSIELMDTDKSPPLNPDEAGALAILEDALPTGLLGRKGLRRFSGHSHLIGSGRSGDTCLLIS